MRPTLDFHRIGKIEVSPVQFFPKTDAPDSQAFWTRTVTLRDHAAGTPFSFNLFTYAGPEALRLPGEPAPEVVTL